VRQNLFGFLWLHAAVNPATGFRCGQGEQLRDLVATIKSIAFRSRTGLVCTTIASQAASVLDFPQNFAALNLMARSLAPIVAPVSCHHSLVSCP
jgi:hypothetical protein